MWGVADAIKDWLLINHLWKSWLAQDVDVANQVKQMGETYQACGDKL